MNTQSLPPAPAGQADENKLIHFWPSEQCAYCRRFTSVALLDVAIEQWFAPVCPLHGYASAYTSAPTPREVIDGRASIERFVVWMHAEQGRVVLVSPVEPDQVPGYQVSIDPFTFEPLAWHCRYESSGGERKDVHVIWETDAHQFFLYEQGQRVREREREVLS